MGGTLLDVLVGSGDAPALVCAAGGPSLTRQAVLQLCTDFANALRNAGLRPGDVVTIADLNTVEFVVAFLGATLARTVAAPLNSAYKPDEFQFYMEDASSQLLVVPEEGNAAAEQAAAALGIPVVAVTVVWAKGRLRLRLASKASASRINMQSLPNGKLSDLPRPSDVALFLHTSGTTSRPKGVPLTHGNLAASVNNIIATYEFTPQDVSLLVMPLFHVHGLMAGLLAPLGAHAKVVLPAEGRFAATTFWRDAVEHQITYYTAVPTMHQILLARADKDYPRISPPPIRVIRSCSSALAPATLQQLEATFKAPVLEAYAMTEASHQMTSNPLPKYGSHKAGTVGKAQGGVQVAILDNDNHVLPVGKIGEVCIRGNNVTAGYLNNPKANAEAYAGGWFHTGDQGFLDPEGYLTLTGRIKELINRGGEKISPIEVDGVLLSHPEVAEACAFAAPDAKYGEVVGAVLVPKSPVQDRDAFIKGVQAHAASKLAKFKVPSLVFITDKLPKTATGKIQRRMMVEHFIKGPQGVSRTPTAAQGPRLELQATAAGPLEGSTDGYTITAKALKAAGVDAVFGVVGIPVTQLASAAQAVGIRFIGTRNEQAAGYAAGAYGFLTGRPGVLLTVSGPGAVHGIAGLSNAQVNCWPMVMLSGSAEQHELGKGSFQELDQVAATAPYCKYAGKACKVEDIPQVVSAAISASMGADAVGKPGAAYIDIPSDVLMAATRSSTTLAVAAALPVPQPILAGASPYAVQQAAQMLLQAQRPLIVVGKGAAMAQAETAARAFLSTFPAPFLGTAMGRGVLPDSHELCVNAARSTALAGADVVLVLGARLNWQLHFGEPPKWSTTVRFILVDIQPSQRDADKAAVTLKGDAKAVLQQLQQAVAQAGERPAFSGTSWVRTLASKVASSKHKLETRLKATAYPLDYSTTLRVIRDALQQVTPSPVVVAEGANTMDNARVILEPVDSPRLRLDAGTWGTMGVGLGYAIAAAVADPSRLVVAVEGDSAFGFSGMEVETLVRYKLPVVVLVFNNGGIYGGDRRPRSLRDAAAAGLQSIGFVADPNPTDFAEQTRYDMMMSAFGGAGYHVSTAQALSAACTEAFGRRQPALINIQLDPLAGVESGNVHSFNAPKAKL